MRRHVPTLVLLVLGGLYVLAGLVWATMDTFAFPQAEKYRPWLAAYLIASQIVLVLVDYGRHLGFKLFVQFLLAGVGFSVYNRAVQPAEMHLEVLFMLALAGAIWVWIRHARSDLGT